MHPWGWAGLLPSLLWGRGQGSWTSPYPVLPCPHPAGVGSGGPSWQLLAVSFGISRFCK